MPPVTTNENLIIQAEVAQRKLKAAEVAYISLLRDYQELQRELVNAQLKLKEMFYTLKQYEKGFAAGSREGDEEF